MNDATPTEPVWQQLEPSLVDQILDAGQIGGEQRELAKEWLTAFVEQIVAGEMTVSRDTETMINYRLAQIDCLLSAQLNVIMHSEEFQKAEAAWRGLNYLVSNTETSPMLKIRVLNVSKKDLLRDLRSAVEFDQSAIFKKVYEEEYGTLGGSPYAVLIGQYEFYWDPSDIEVLEKMSNVAAAAHAPFIAAASPRMFNWDSFTELNGPRDLHKIFDSDQYLKWKFFRESEDSRFVGLVLPHVLLRAPYGNERVPVEEFRYEEGVDGYDHTKYLWGNPAYAFAVRLTNAFAQYTWCAAIHGVERGGLIGGLPLHEYLSEDGDIAQKCPTEFPITDRREAELSRLGFMPLCHSKGTDKAVFFSVPSCHKPRRYFEDEVNANAGLAAQLDYVMAASRFAHFLKAMMRDKIGSFKTRAECEQYLTKWISQYVLSDETASPEIKAKFPLGEARVEVFDVAGKPGTYKAVAHLRPYFQLEAMTVPMRVTIMLPQSRA